MATLTKQTINRNGVEPTLVAAEAGGDDFVNSGREWLEVVNDDAVDTVLTVVTPRTTDGLAIADRTINIPAGARLLVGPFPAATYSDPETNKVALNYNKVTGLTIGLFDITY